jgi:uncharacterized membrane protein
MNVQISVDRPEVSAKASARNRSGKGRTYVYTPGSLWSHLKYGLGALAVIVIPPLFPGVTGRGLIMGYMGALVAVLTIVCVWGMVRSLHSHEGRR